MHQGNDTKEGIYFMNDIANDNKTIDDITNNNNNEF